jgi:hypothetical protein
MADWKQITARIRRARTSKDPAGQLSNLYEKTRDAMAAFELARYYESTGQAADAGKWYAAAAERFRRADWKTKAQEAAVRLGAVVPAGVDRSAVAPLEETPSQRADDFRLTPPPATAPEAPLPFEPNAASPEAGAAPQEESSGASPPTPMEKKRRRGRRGGRNRRKPGAAGRFAPAPLEEGSSKPPVVRHGAPQVTSEVPAEPRHTRIGHGRPIPPLPVEAPTEPPVPGLRGRYGDPGLSSRLSQLELNFRRLLTCDPARLDEADRAPVGPGVFVLTDSDLTTYYYVEACQTLRIAVANLLRGGSSRRGESIKPQLAEHLGIPETRVAKYLADHCVVRWLQLDEGASHFAHFVIAVLRPILNE